jgi:hypothetical protein
LRRVAKVARGLTYWAISPILGLAERTPEIRVVAKRRVADRFAATKSESNLLVLFIPSVDRNGVAINQETWVSSALEVLGRSFGGAPAFPKARGVWRDDAGQGKLVFDEPVVIQCYTNEASLEKYSGALRDFLIRMGEETNQGAVGFVIDRDYLEISFPLEGPKHGKKRSSRSK